MTAALEVLATGALTLVQDSGRPGLAALGVGRSGAADRTAFALGARLLGQRADLAALEVTMGGLAVRATGRMLLALTGALVPATVDGRAVPHAGVVELSGGQVLRLGVPPQGLRTYLGVRGGIDVEPVLGSRATDVLSGVGPAVVAAGDVLPIGDAPRTHPVTDHAPLPPWPTGIAQLDILPGPRTGWIGGLSELTRHQWVVGAESNRVGIRLSGASLARSAGFDVAELASEGVVRGAIQAPPRGEPVVFLADHPVTGGYPVVAVLTEAACDRAAQLRPGEQVRLAVAGPARGD